MLHSVLRLGWKGLTGTNTLAYYKNLLITAVKSYIVQAFGYKNPILSRYQGDIFNQDQIDAITVFTETFC
jgi:hypothetical protein